MMVREFIVSNVKNRECLDGILAVLAELYRIKARYFKPRFWGDYHITIQGPDEDEAFNLFAIFASRAGWKIE